MSSDDKPAAHSAAKAARGIYLLPNLFTTAGLFAGFYAIVAAMRGHFSYAAIAIFIAMIADSLDGRVARLTNTESAFGAEFDSLSDMVAFGVAPALVVYSWALFSLGKVGWLAAFIYTAGTALRLARFNISSDTMDKRYFAGLPSPAAAGVVAGCVWFGRELHLAGGSQVTAIIAGLITLIAGLLMVSNLRYYSFKTMDLKRHVPFVAILLVMLVFVFISVDPPTVLFCIFSCYAITGPVMALWRWRRFRKVRHRKVKKNES